MQCRRHGLRQTRPPVVALQPAQEHAGITRSPFRGFPLGTRCGWGASNGFAVGATRRLPGSRRIRSCCCAATGLAASPIYPRFFWDTGASGSPSGSFSATSCCTSNTFAGSPAPSGNAGRSCSSWLYPAARLAANCAALLGGFEHRLGHQAAKAPTAARAGGVAQPLDLLSAWYGRPSSETFLPSSLLPARTRNKQGRA